MKRILAVFASLLLGTANAADIPAELKDIPQSDSMLLRPGDKQYPLELVASGVQGVVLVRVGLDAAGKAAEVSLGASSRSAQRDETAVALVRESKLTVPGAAEKKLTAIVVPVEFYKDSVTNLGKKSCADFNADLAYFSTTFPDLDLAEMRVFKISTGAIFLMGRPADAVKFSKQLKPARAATVESCKAHPDQAFFNTLQQALKDASRM